MITLRCMGLAFSTKSQKNSHQNVILELWTRVIKDMRIRSDLRRSCDEWVYYDSLMYLKVFQKANQWRWDIYITVWFRWSANWTLRKWGGRSSDLQYIRIMWMYTAVLYNETGAFLLFLIRCVICMVTILALPLC